MMVGRLLYFVSALVVSLSANSADCVAYEVEGIQNVYYENEDSYSGNDEFDEEHTAYYKNDSDEREGIYVDENDYENNGLVSEEQYVDYVATEKEGEENFGDASGKKEYKTYFDTGELKSVASVVDGKMHGKYTTYYKNGNIESEGQYVEDVAQGMFFYYDEEGYRIRDANYVDNQAQGEFHEYYPDGALKAVGYFKDGILNGGYVEFLENGKDILFSTYYVDGHIVGNYGGFGYYNYDDEIYVFRARNDKYFKNVSEYNSYLSDVRSKYNKYKNYTGDDGSFSYKYLKFLYGKFNNDYGNSFGILNGSFIGGKFTGTITNNKKKLQLLTIKDGKIEGGFQGLLPNHILKKIRNSKIFLDFYDSHEFLGRGTIKDGMFVGKIDSAYSDISTGKEIFAYNPYVSGFFDENGFSGNVMSKDGSFYTFKNARLNGYVVRPKTSEKMVEYVYYKDGVIFDNAKSFSCTEGKDCIYKFLGKKLGIVGPWLERFEKVGKYYSHSTGKLEKYWGTSIQNNQVKSPVKVTYGSDKGSNSGGDNASNSHIVNKPVTYNKKLHRVMSGDKVVYEYYSM